MVHQGPYCTSRPWDADNRKMIEHPPAPPPHPQERLNPCPSYQGKPTENTNTEFSPSRVGKETQLTRGSSSQRRWSLLLPRLLFQEINMKGTEKQKVEPAYRAEVYKRAVAKMYIHSVISTKCSLARTHREAPDLRTQLYSQPQDNTKLIYRSLGVIINHSSKQGRSC